MTIHGASHSPERRSSKPQVKRAELHAFSSETPLLAAPGLHSGESDLQSGEKLVFETREEGVVLMRRCVTCGGGEFASFPIRTVADLQSALSSLEASVHALPVG